MQKNIVKLLDSVLTEEVIAQLAEGYVDMCELRRYLAQRIYDHNVKRQCAGPLIQTGFAFGLSAKQIHRILFGR